MLYSTYCIFVYHVAVNFHGNEIIVQWECLAVGKFGKFGEPSVIHQTLTSQNLAYK